MPPGRFRRACTSQIGSEIALTCWPHLYHLGIRLARDAVVCVSALPRHEHASPARRPGEEAGLQSLLSVTAITIAVGSVIFAAIQNRILARQTRVLQATTELSYNLELIVCLNERILRIADDRGSRAYVWGKLKASRAKGTLRYLMSGDQGIRKIGRASC